MRLRAWNCPKCKRKIITLAHIHGIGCRCGVMLHADTKYARQSIEREKEEGVISSKKHCFVIPEQFKIKTKELYSIISITGTKYDFKDELE